MKNEEVSLTCNNDKRVSIDDKTRYEYLEFYLLNLIFWVDKFVYKVRWSEKSTQQTSKLYTNKKKNFKSRTTKLLNKSFSFNETKILLKKKTRSTSFTCLWSVPVVLAAVQTAQMTRWNATDDLTYLNLAIDRTLKIENQALNVYILV